MKLQIAIDMVTSEKALEMADQIHDLIGIIEIGTPMIVREGMTAVRMLKEKYPACTVLADTKIVDGGEIEASDAFEAGADIATVLGVADDETIKGVVKAARKFNRKTMADMICITDVAARAKELDLLGIDYICVHTAIDVQGQGKNPYQDLAAMIPALQNAKAAVAGGVTLEALPLLNQLQPEIIVAGSALTKKENLRQAVKEMLHEMKN